MNKWLSLTNYPVTFTIEFYYRCGEESVRKLCSAESIETGNRKGQIKFDKCDLKNIAFDIRQEDQKQMGVNTD